jgi:hypothetical protein
MVGIMLAPRQEAHERMAQLHMFAERRLVHIVGVLDGNCHLKPGCLSVGRLRRGVSACRAAAPWRPVRVA